MWIFSFFLWNTLQGLIVSESNCEKKVSAVCNIEYNKGIPENERDIQDFCRNLIPFIRCMETFIKECGTEQLKLVELKEGQLSELAALSEALCQTGTNINKIVIKKFDCMTDVLETNRVRCQSFIEGSVSKWAKHETGKTDLDKVEKDQDEFWEKYRCLYHLLEMTCYLVKISNKCEGGVKTLYTDLISEKGPLGGYCPEEVRPSINKAIKFLNLSNKEKKQIKTLIQSL